MIGRTCGIVLAIFLSAIWVSGQATQPADKAGLDYRAGRAFERGDYAAALPLLRKLSDDLKDKPAKLGMVEERIRACERMLAAAATQPAAPARTMHRPPAPGKQLELTIKELGNFEYDEEKGGQIPEDVKRLSGTKVKMRGFMMPIDQSARITQFALVPSLFGCCYGAPPQVQHVIIVRCPKGSQVELSPDEVIIEGTLSVQEKKEEGFVISLFEVAAGSVKGAN